MGDINAFDLLLHDLLFETQQFSQAIEKEKQLISDHEKRIEETVQDIKLDNEVADQHEEDIAVLQKQLLHNVKNIESMKETCNVLSSQEHCLDDSVKKLKQDGLTKEADHQEVLAHYHNVVKRRRDTYENQPTSLTLRQKESRRSECERQLSQLSNDINDIQVQIDEQINRRDMLASANVITSTKSFCIKFNGPTGADGPLNPKRTIKQCMERLELRGLRAKFTYVFEILNNCIDNRYEEKQHKADMYVANMKRCSEISQKNAAARLLEKDIEDLEGRLRERAAQEAHNLAMREAHAMAEQQKKAHDEWVHKETYSRAQAWAEQQKRADMEWTQIQKPLKYVPTLDVEAVAANKHQRHSVVQQQQSPSRDQSVSQQPRSRFELSLNSLSLSGNDVSSSPDNRRSPPRILFPSVARPDETVPPVRSIQELLKSLERRGDYSLPSSSRNSVKNHTGVTSLSSDISQTMECDSVIDSRCTQVASSCNSTEISLKTTMSKSSVVSDIQPMLSLPSAPATSTATICPVQHGDSHAVSTSRSEPDDTAREYPSAAMAVTTITCPMTTATGIPNKATAAVSPMVSDENQQSASLVDCRVMNNLQNSGDHFFTSAPHDTEDTAAENVVLSRKLCDTEPSSLAIIKTPNRPFVKNATTPNAAHDANQVNIGFKSPHFDWNKHMSTLKMFAASPGLMMYSGRHMFSPGRDATLCVQQFPQLSQTSECQMEMDSYKANISNDDNQVATIAKNVSSDGSVSCDRENATNMFMFDMGKSSICSTDAGVCETGNVLSDLFNWSANKQQEYTLSEPSGNKMLSFGSQRETGATENRSDAFYLDQGESEMESVSSATYPGSFDFSFSCNTPGLTIDTNPGATFNLSFGDSGPVSDDSPFKLF